MGCCQCLWHPSSFVLMKGGWCRSRAFVPFLHRGEWLCLWVAGMGIVFACTSWVWSLGDVAWLLSVVWWSWVEQSRNITPCDIHIMFNFNMRSHADMNFELYLECYTTNVFCICLFSSEKFVMSAFFIREFVMSLFSIKKLCSVWFFIRKISSVRFFHQKVCSVPFFPF